MNKYQEALKAICFGCDDYVIGGCEPKCCKLYVPIKELVDKQEKYRWHDLRKDPNDLPPDCLNVLLVKETAEGNKYLVGYIYKNILHNIKDDGYSWRSRVFISNDNDIIAWKYIEELKDE